MADVRDIVTDALQELGVIAADETAPASDALFGLVKLNRFVNQAAAEKLLIYTVTRTTYLFVASTQNYTVGTGGNFSVVRPTYIDHLNYQDSATSPAQETLLGESLTEDAWAALTPKTLTATFPTCYYYNPTYPTGTISLWPVPTSTTLTGCLYAPQQVAEFTSLSQAISLPPGYHEMLVTNLAVLLAPSYERRAQPELIQAASKAISIVKRSNLRKMEMGFEPGALIGSRSGWGYDIKTDR